MQQEHLILTQNEHPNEAMGHLLPSLIINGPPYQHFYANNQQRINPQAQNRQIQRERHYENELSNHIHHQLPSIEFLLNSEERPYHFPRNLCLNPEITPQQNRNKIKHIDELNKSVKEIMKSNQQYRGELLSAYQSKSKIHLQNVLLAKQKENLEEEKLTLYAQLEEATKKVTILEGYNLRIRQQYAKSSEKMKQQIDQLHQEVNSLRNLKYDLDNRSNENKLLNQKRENDQVTIRELQCELEKLSNENTLVKTELQMVRNRERTVEGEKSHFIFSNTANRKMAESYEESLKKTNAELSNLTKAMNSLQWQYDNLSKQHHYQKKRANKLLEELEDLEKSHQSSLREIDFNQQEKQSLVQELKAKQAQNVLLKAQAAIMFNALSNSQALSEKLQQKQSQLHELAIINNKFLLQLNQTKVQFNKLKYQTANLKEMLDIQSQNFQEELNSLTFNHSNQLRVLLSSTQKEQQERQRLSIALMKKQDLILQKERDISRNIEEILHLEDQNKRKDEQIEQKQQQIVIQNAKIEDLQAHISTLQQSLKQMKEQCFQQLKKEVKVLTERDTLIQKLQKELASLNETSQKEISQLNCSLQQKGVSAALIINNLESKLKDRKEAIAKLENEVQRLSLEGKNLLQRLKSQETCIQQQHQAIQNYKTENIKLKNLNEDLKGEISIIEAEYEELQKALNKQTQTKAKISQNLSSQEYSRQKLSRLYEKSLREIEQLKTKSQMLEFKRLNAKNQYESEIATLTSELNYFKSDHQRIQITNDTLQAIYKQIHTLGDYHRILTTDPKISIARFSTHVNSTHRQAFTREIQKLKQHLSTLSHLSHELKGSIQHLKLSMNTLHRGFEITFSQKKIPSEHSIQT